MAQRRGRVLQPLRSSRAFGAGRIRPEAAEAAARRESNTLEGIKRGGGRPTIGAIRVGPNVQTQGSFASGGQPFAGLHRDQAFASRIQPSSSDSIRAALMAQVPSNPLAKASYQTPWFTANDTGVQERTPTVYSANIEVFNLKYPFFIRRETTDSKVWEKSNRQTPYSRRDRMLRRGKKKQGVETILSLPALNELLFRTQVKDNNKESNPKEYYAQRSLDPADVARMWAFDGFVLSQMHGANRTGIKSDIDFSKGMTILLAMDGLTPKIFNIWGDAIKRTNQKLWFLILGVDRGTHSTGFTFGPGTNLPETFNRATYRTNPEAVDTQVPPKTDKMGKQGKVYCDMPVQIIPWTSELKDIPDDAELKYVDEFGATRYGCAIPVGHVRVVGPTDDMNGAVGAAFDAERINACPDMTLIQNPYYNLSYML